MRRHSGRASLNHPSPLGNIAGPSESAGPKAPAKAGMVLGMQEPHKKGVANHLVLRVMPRLPRSETFDFLGLTHHWGKSMKGNATVKRKTATSRLSRAVKRVRQYCRRNRHRPLTEQHQMLAHKLRGHYSYYGITGNMRALTAFWEAVQRVWRYWLDRRGGKRGITWPRFSDLLKRHALPRPRIVHSALRPAANPSH
jgi:hypothetical protein